MKERVFVKFLKEYAVKNGFKYFSSSDDWYISLTKGNKKIETVGYNFPLNNSIAKLVCLDKVLTSQVLEKGNIENVSHFLVFGDYKRKFLGIKTKMVEDLKKTLLDLKYPLVVKPTQGTTGRDVFLCKNFDEVMASGKKIAKQEDFCVSEYVESEFEYRFYMLEGKIEVAFKKIKKDNWKHNLSFGAKPHLLTKTEITKFKTLCEKISKCLSLKVGAIDFLFKEGKPVVLEVNTGVSMDNFSRFSKENEEIARKYHFKILNKC
jgi:ribosomal protein S6--L-glutamate ligase